MKKSLIFMLTIIMFFVLTACGGEKIDNLKHNVDTAVTKMSGDEPEVTDEEKAQEVAKKFAKSFFTLTDKTEDNYVGGYEYVHAGIRDEFINTVKKDIFPPYADMVKQAGGKDKLPEVSEVKIENLREEEIEYEGAKHKSFNMDAVVTYKVEENGFDINRINVNVTFIDNTWVITSVKL